MHLDDALDVSSVHGIPGVIGSIFIGFAAQQIRGSPVEDGVVFGGSGHLLAVQSLAVVVVMAYSAVVTWILMTVIRKIMGRISVRVRHRWSLTRRVFIARTC